MGSAFQSAGVGDQGEGPVVPDFEIPNDYVAGRRHGLTPLLRIRPVGGFEGVFPTPDPYADRTTGYAVWTRPRNEMFCEIRLLVR